MDDPVEQVHRCGQRTELSIAKADGATAKVPMRGFPPLRTINEIGTMAAMARYLKKQVAVEAVQWFKHGDHPAVHQEFGKDTTGYIDTPEGRLTVIPGDWIITGIAGENYPCKPDIFEKLYSPDD